MQGCTMTKVKGLPTDFLEEISQGGTSIYMPPAFRHISHKLDDWHRRSHFHPSLLPSSAYAMTSDGFSLGELGFDLSLKIANNPRPEEVRVVHLIGFAGLDNLDVDLLPTFGFAQVHEPDLLPGLIKKIEVMEASFLTEGTFSLLLPHTLKGDLAVAEGELGLKATGAADELERIGDDFLLPIPCGFDGFGSGLLKALFAQMLNRSL